MSQQTILFPWTTCPCACGARVGVASCAGTGWIPEAGDGPYTAHRDVEPCAHCRCLILRPGCLTVSESRAARRFVPDLVDAQRRRN